MADPPTAGEPDAGVFAPASDSDILRAIGGATPPVTQQAKRGRGRPPGAKNLSPVERASRERQRIAQQTGQPVDERTALEKAQAKAVAIKEKAAEFEVLISNDLNEHIMSLLLQVGFSPQMLYTEGNAPTATAHIGKYTELGNTFAIPPALAKSAAKLAAEATATDTGAKLTAATGNGKAGLVVAGIGVIFGTVTYARNVNNVLGKIKEMKEAQERWQASQDQGGNSIGVQPQNEGIR